MQEPEAPVFEEPDGEDGEGEQQDEDEQVGAVLPVALLSLFLGNDVLHGTVLLRWGCSAHTDAHRQAHQHEQPQRPRRPPGAVDSHFKHHVGVLSVKCSGVVEGNSKLWGQYYSRTGGSAEQKDDSNRGINSGPEVKTIFFQKVYNVYFSVKAPWRQVACLNPLSRTHRGFTYCLWFILLVNKEINRLRCFTRYITCAIMLGLTNDSYCEISNIYHSEQEVRWKERHI